MKKIYFVVLWFVLAFSIGAGCYYFGLIDKEFFKTLGATDKVNQTQQPSGATKYNIVYSCNYGDCSKLPNAASYGIPIKISNPVKKITFKFDTSSSKNAISLKKVSSVTKSLKFIGWSFDGDKNTAKYGSTSSNVVKNWTDKVTSTYFVDLASRNANNVNMTANWSDSITLPAINPKKVKDLDREYICQWNLSKDGTGASYQPGSTYNATNKTKSVTFYAICNAEVIKKIGKDDIIDGGEGGIINANKQVLKSKTPFDGLFVAHSSSISKYTTSLQNLQQDGSTKDANGLTYSHVLIRPEKYYTSGSKSTESNEMFPDNGDIGGLNGNLSLNFNLTIDSKYQDVRVKINYFTTNIGNSEINVLDYDSLKFYVAVAQKDFSFKKMNIDYDATEYLGVFTRKYGTDTIYEDNWDIVSTNLLANSEIKYNFPYIY